MLGLGGLLFVCGILTHCMCTMTDRAAEQCNDIVPIEPVSIFFTAQKLADTNTSLDRSLCPSPNPKQTRRNSIL